MRKYPRPDEASVLVVGTVRDVGKKLVKSVQSISRALESFSNVAWFLVESDSSDSTLQVLELLAKDESFDFVSLGSLAHKYPLRTERIAYCRNRYRQEVEFRSAACSAQRPDFVCVVDLDGVCDRLSKEAVDSCWDAQYNWDAVFANQAGRYYDIWALRHPVWMPGDCYVERSQLMRLGFSRHSATIVSVFSKMQRIPKNADWIAVDSAFGGFGIYTISAFLKGVYSGVSPCGSEICEHVSFHEKLRADDLQLYINPALINSRSTWHSSDSYRALSWMWFNLFRLKG